MRASDCVWTNSIPDEADFHLCERDGWIMMDCRSCNKAIMAATHLDLFDWIWKAEMHYIEYCDPIDKEYNCSRCSEA